MPESNFLPEDYVAERAEQRTNRIGLVLFVIVMTAVVGAFLVTNRQWAMVKQEQKEINLSYADAAKQIETLNVLEAQKKQILEKAEVTAALVERVPRSILLAELINRMPESVSLELFELKSTKVKVHQPKSKKDPKKKVKSIKDKMPTKGEDETERKIEVPTFRVAVSLEGYAPTDIQVSDYLSALTSCPLLNDVQLKYSRETQVENQTVREFRFEMTLDPKADAKGFEPLKLRRALRNPLKGNQEFQTFNDSLTGVELDEDTKR